MELAEGLQLGEAGGQMMRYLRFRHLARKCLQRWLRPIAQAWRRPDERDPLPAISDHLLRDIGISRLEAAFMDFGSLPGAPPLDVGCTPRASLCSSVEQLVHRINTPPPPVAPRNRLAPEARPISQSCPSH
jgi:uncharacterized protein YjiS (DUF1127 family)